MVYSCLTQFGGTNMFLILIFWIIFIALLARVIIKFVLKENSLFSLEKNPLEIVKLRYAKGEINKSKFEEIKKELNKR